MDALVLGAGLAGAAAAWWLAERGARVALLSPANDLPLGARAQVELPGHWMGKGEAAAVEVWARVRARGVATVVEDREDAVVFDGDRWVAQHDRSLAAPHLVVAPEPIPSTRLSHCARFFGRGLSLCAWSDAPLFSGRVVVTGDGPATLEAARLVARFATPVLVGDFEEAETFEHLPGRVVDAEGGDTVSAAVVVSGERRSVVACHGLVEAYDPVVDGATTAWFAALSAHAPHRCHAVGLLAGIPWHEGAGQVASGVAAARAIPSPGQ